MPALRNIPVVDADLRWAGRESIPGQRRNDHVEVLQHRQQFQIVKESAWPAVREDERHTKAGCGALVHKMDAVPSELVEGVELALPGMPVELTGPVGREAPQPVQLSSLSPAYAGYLVGPSCMAQPCPQVVEHLVCNMNPKRLHYNNVLLAGPAERAFTRSGYHSHKRPCRQRARTPSTLRALTQRAHDRKFSRARGELHLHLPRDQPAKQKFAGLANKGTHARQ